MKTLPYAELYYKLKDEFSSGLSDLIVPGLGIKISERKFISNTGILPGNNNYCCNKHNIDFPNPQNNLGSKGKTDLSSGGLLDLHDSEIRSNSSFEYYIVDSANSKNANKTPGRVIILFHGLNEKKWDKYLPWAYALHKNTSRPVILFPLAFHMGRAPAEWSNSRDMAKEARRRADELAGNSHSSFVNAAISSRLSANPERFFWTGMQSFNDIERLLCDIYEGRVEGLQKGTGADLFGYSIGAFFALILMMANPGRLLSNSRLFTFCGGATLDRMYPISRYIMDSKAASAVNSYYLELMNGDLSAAGRIGHYLDSGLHPGESVFKLMLLYHHNKNEREALLKKLEGRIHAVALKQDSVVPPAEVLNTLKGEMRNINNMVEIEDFVYPYNHVTPFTLSDKFTAESTKAFYKIMDRAGEFLR